jgi:hypothetical protein
MLARLERALAATDTTAVTEMMAHDVTRRVAAHPGRADGLLVVRPGQDGPISDLTVFLRPLTALQALAEEMGRRMGEPRPGGAA